MRVISRRTLREYIDSKAGHRDQKSLKNALDAWFAEVQKANWENTNDVKRNYTWASIISSDRIVFDILTDRYRLVTGRFRKRHSLDQMDRDAQGIRQD